MTGEIHLDRERLDRDGFVVLPGLVGPDELTRFERDLAVAGEQLAARRGIDTDDGHPLDAVLRGAGPHRPALFDHVKRLFCVQRMAVDIGARLEQAGLFGHGADEVPLVWPTVRADLPGESTYLLPLHQDFETTRCSTAWRLWIPLRPADDHHGTMLVSPGSHRHHPFTYVNDTGFPQVPPEDLARRGLTTQAFTVPAGHGVLFSPWLVHGSVANRSARTKWVLLLHVQDLSTFVDPDDPDEAVGPFLLLSAARTAR